MYPVSDFVKQEENSEVGIYSTLPSEPFILAARILHQQ